jgi:hypothetical protein
LDYTVGKKEKKSVDQIVDNKRVAEFDSHRSANGISLYHRQDNNVMLGRYHANE